VKQQRGELLGPARRGRLVRPPMPLQGPAEGTLPVDGTGWTLYRDVALRLKSISVDEFGPALGDLREPPAFKIRLAGSPHVRGDADVLVQHRYAGKGYRTSAPPAGTNVCTFAAYDDGRIAGTLSLRLDSTGGLAADEIYRTEIDVLRGAGLRVCEFTRLAVDASGASKSVLAGLFHTAYLYAKKLQGFDSVVIEVNPRHVGYYRKALGFVILGTERLNPRVNAPAVLMGIPFEEIAGRLHRHAGGMPLASKSSSPFAYGFSPAEEAGILGRLRGDREHRNDASGRDDQWELVVELLQ
jgi:hypothetical protein